MVVMTIDEIGDGATEISEEAGAEIAVAKDAPGHDGKIRHRIVPSPPLKLFTEVSGPVGAAQFPAIGGQIFQTLTNIGTASREQRKNGLLPIEIESRRIKIVDGQSLPCTTGS